MSRGFTELLNDIRDTLEELDRKIFDEVICKDIVEVVRCKDCRHGETMKTKLAGRITAVFCHLNKKERFMKGDDYCSYGERGRE